MLPGNTRLCCSCPTILDFSRPWCMRCTIQTKLRNLRQRWSASPQSMRHELDHGLLVRAISESSLWEVRMVPPSVITNFLKVWTLVGTHHPFTTLVLLQHWLKKSDTRSTSWSIEQSILHDKDSMTNHLNWSCTTSDYRDHRWQNEDTPGNCEKYLVGHGGGLLCDRLDSEYILSLYYYLSSGWFSWRREEEYINFGPKSRCGGIWAILLAPTRLKQH